MKFLQFLLHIAALITFIVNPAKASSDGKLPATSQTIESSVRVAQAGASDSKKSTGGISSDDSKSLPAIVPDAKQCRSSSFYL